MRTILSSMVLVAVNIPGLLLILALCLLVIGMECVQLFRSS